MTQAAPYSFVQFSAAKQQLSNRLFDSSQVFWSNTEVGLYLIEALRTWNALTSYWRGDFTFQSQQGVTWYDLTDTVAMPNTLRPITVLDTDLYTLIQLHLLEPAVGVNPWTGVSAQFTANDLISAVQRRMDEALSITSCTQSRLLVGAQAGRILLPDNVIDVRRVAYLPNLVNLTGAGYGTGLYGMGPYGVSLPPVLGIPVPSVVWPEDTWGEQSFNRLFTLLPAGTPGTPSTYLLSDRPPLSFDTDVPPSFAGQYELLTVNAGPGLVATAPQPLPISDDWTHVIKWGALADLFSRDSLSRDPLRAQYCEQRYRMGLKLLVLAPALLAMRIDNLAVQIDSVRGADLFNTSWEGAGQGFPTGVLHSGLNLIALTPPPDAGVVGPGGSINPYMMTVTVVENAPVPVADTDFVQVGREDLEAILDYAQHIASLKMGGAEFMATMPLLERFLKQASLYGLKLDEIGEFTSMLYALSSSEKAINPVLAPAEESVTGGA